jgi:hypothetical protein
MPERTGFWIGEKLAKAAITSTARRRVTSPARVVDPAAFAEQVGEARALLMDWPAQVDQVALAAELVEVARTELNVDYVVQADKDEQPRAAQCLSGQGKRYLGLIDTISRRLQLLRRGVLESGSPLTTTAPGVGRTPGAWMSGKDIPSTPGVPLLGTHRRAS